MGLTSCFRYKTFKLSCISFTVCVLLIYSGIPILLEHINLKRVLSFPLTQRSSKWPNSTFRVPLPPQSLHHTQISRLENFEEACSIIRKQRNSTYKGRNSTVYYYSKTHNFSYCKVQKVGSTFFTQMFELLKSGVSRENEIFTKTRRFLHQSSMKFSTKFDSKIFKQSKIIIVSRDPYSRLFSGYIDKVYVPILTPREIVSLMPKSRRNAFKRQNAGVPGQRQLCSIIPSFQDFLYSIIERVSAGKSINRHWAPIAAMCRPCDTHPSYLLKQESFTSDITYFLQELNLSQQLYETLTSALKRKRVEYSIPGIIKELFLIYHKQEQQLSSILCLNKSSFFKRVWDSFQTQGYINVDAPFRLNRSSGDVTETVFTDVVLDSIEAAKMTEEQRSIQRKRAIADAYRKITPETIEALKRIYQQDFLVFGYDLEPPKYV